MENLKEKEERQVMMFGETVKDMTESKPEFLSNTEYAMSILSDAQEVLSVNPNLARQFINKAKYFISRKEGV